MTLLDSISILSILIQASPPLVNELVLLLITFIFTGVMAIMGWFLRDAAINLRNNTHAIQDMKLSFAKEQAITSGLRAQCDHHATKVDREIREHFRKLEQTNLRLTVLENEVNGPRAKHIPQYEEDSDSRG